MINTMKAYKLHTYLEWFHFLLAHTEIRVHKLQDNNLASIVINITDTLIYLKLGVYTNSRFTFIAIQPLVILHIDWTFAEIYFCPRVQSIVKILSLKF